jgi:hypothetical protein
LAEVAFHQWDLGASLGNEGPLESEAATYLLPFILESVVPAGMARRESKPGPLTVQFNVSDGSAGWHADMRADGLRVSRGASGAEVTVGSTPGWLALAAYGRTRINRPEFAVSGAADAAERFAAVFGG